MFSWLNQYSGALQVIIAIVALCIPSTVIFSIIKKIGMHRHTIHLEFNIEEKPIPKTRFHYVNFEASTQSKKPIELKYLGPAYLRKGYYQEMPFDGLDMDGRAVAGKPLKKSCFIDDFWKQISVLSIYTEIFICAKSVDGTEYVKSCGTVSEIAKTIDRIQSQDSD